MASQCASPQPRRLRSQDGHREPSADRGGSAPSRMPNPTSTALPQTAGLHVHCWSPSHVYLGHCDRPGLLVPSPRRQVSADVAFLPGLLRDSQDGVSCLRGEAAAVTDSEDQRHPWHSSSAPRPSVLPGHTAPPDNLPHAHSHTHLQTHTCAYKHRLPGSRGKPQASFWRL